MSCEDNDTQGECPMTTEMEIGVMQLKAKKHSPLAATTRSNKEIRCRFSGKL
jgi:hypothetical protein